MLTLVSPAKNEAQNFILLIDKRVLNFVGMTIVITSIKVFVWVYFLVPNNVRKKY